MPSMVDHLSQVFPTLAERLPRITLADLPTRAELRVLSIGNKRVPIIIKHDEETNAVYGGNKVRKLEYLLQRALEHKASRVATFGAVASNHAIATALHSATVGLDCTCLLSHQFKTPQAALALNMHLKRGTEIVRYGGKRPQRVATMRRYVRGRNAWVIPIGGSNWLGAVAFFNAGLELAAQVADRVIPAPDRLYVANGTMATVAGLALGIAAAGLDTEIQAIRVTHKTVAHPQAMRRLLHKTAFLMHRLDSSVPEDLAGRARIHYRDEFFGTGYAHPTPAGDRAIELAAEQLGLKLESTYTGKALAALLHDLQQSESTDQHFLFWNTYAAKSLPVSAARPDDTSGLPAEFLRYFD